MSNFVHYNRPSIFVLWAQDNLNQSIRRAIRFLFKFISENYPERFHNLNNNFDELYLLFDILLQWSHLIRWNSSFTERFFSIQRICIENSRLQQRDILKSLIQLCFIPYVMDKFEHYYNYIREKHLINCDNQNSGPLFQLTKWDYLLLHYYPQFQKLCKIIQILLWLSYASGNEHSHSFLLQLLWFGKLKFCHSNLTTEVDENLMTFWSKISLGLSSIFDLTFRSCAFLIQFLEHWNLHTDLRRLFQQQTNPLFIPIPRTDSNQTSISNRNLCPLCHKKRVNETALASSGYVFCYVCIYNYLKTNHRCPITGFPSELEQLVRIFS